MALDDEIDEEEHEGGRLRMRPVDFKLPPEVGSGVGKLPPFNPDAEEPAQHIYAKAHLIAKNRLDPRLPLGSTYITPDHANAVKVEGTEAFREGNWELAQSRYEDAASLLLRDVYKAERGLLSHAPEYEHDEGVMKLMNSCFLNSATCLLKFADTQTDTEVKHSCWKRCMWHTCIALANNGIVLADPSKALYRRGMARMHLKQWVGAVADLKNAIKADPKSKELRKAYEDCLERKETERRMEKEFFSFDRMSQAIETKEEKIEKIKKEADDSDTWTQAKLFHKYNQSFQPQIGPGGTMVTNTAKPMDDDVDD